MTFAVRTIQGLTASASTINLTVSSNTTSYNLFTAAGSPTGPANVTLTVNSGVFLGGPFVGSTTPALDTGSGWASGSTLTVVNNGSIIGAGGYGPAAGSGSAGPGINAGDGGPAINAQYAVTITNNGTVAGGGGGGGSGGQTTAGAAGGNATGAGTAAGPALQSALGGTGGTTVSGTAGAAGSGPEVNGNTATNASTTATNGQGGGGGGYGAPGGSGGSSLSPTYVGGYGGSGGAFATGNSFITWASPGTRYGSINTGNFTLLSGDGGTVTGSSSVASGSGVAAVASLQFNPVGTGGVVATTKSSNSRLRWSNAANRGTLPGASAWIRLTVQSGSAPSTGTINSWLALSSAVTWNWNSPASTAGTISGTVLVEISTSSSGSPVVSSAVYTMTATHA